MKRQTTKTFWCGAAIAACACAAFGDVKIENARFRLTLGDDASAKSLVLKATGEELLDAREPTPFFAVTQERPFNNEIKLAFPNQRTTYPANRVRRDGDKLVVGFATAPYEAVVRVKTTDDYAAFTLEDFVVTEKSYPLCPTTTKPLDFTAPPVAEFRVAQLPVKERANFGEWMNVMWDGKAAAGVFATSRHAIVGAEKRVGRRLMFADALRSVKVRGTGAAVVADVGGEAILDRMDAVERDFDLPRGVANRRNPLVNASIYFASGVSPKTIDRHIAFAKRGGFRLMEMSCGDFFGAQGDYEFNSNFPNGFADAKALLDKVHAAGILPGMHILHTFVSPVSKLVKGGADRRLLLEEHYTLSRAVGADDAEIYVDEDPRNAEMSEKCRILKFGRELMTYEGYTSERPYKFFGVKRGAKGTPAAPHEEGLIGGTVWVCEYGGYDYYLKQDSDLQDVIAAKVAAFWKAGMRFVYFDGSEGVCPPFGFNVPNAQYRMWSKLEPQPILGEGAAKAHFGWHMLSGANAFDVFAPEEFKAKIDEYPAAEAPLMRRDFTRVNFGWWGFWTPGAKIRGVTTMGVQPDHWEYGTAKAAAWDSPVSVQMNVDALAAHPRTADVLETMRRWEDVRARKLLTPAQKERIRAGGEWHLLVDENGEYELVAIKQIASANDVRAFEFERGEFKYVVFSHNSGEGKFELPIAPRDGMALFEKFGGAEIPFGRKENSVVLPAGSRRYFRWRK